MKMNRSGKKDAVALTHLRMSDGLKRGTAYTISSVGPVSFCKEVTNQYNGQQGAIQWWQNDALLKKKRGNYSTSILISLRQMFLFMYPHSAAGKHREQGAHLPEGSDWQTDKLLRWATPGWLGGISGFHGDGYGLHIIETDIGCEGEVSWVVILPGTKLVKGFFFF